jgi:peptidoglycan/xylan/chitin deacetylase (PgdA/CDA1 family)
VTRFAWPEGKQVAVALTFDVDGEVIPLVRDPEHGHEKLTLISSAAYGPAVGVPRILDVLKNAGIKGSFYIPGFTAELHPPMVERIIGEGHEIGHHGYLHERPDTLSDDEEEAVLARGIDVLERLTGRKPVGYRSPAWELKVSSPALLKRYGFRYDSSLMGNDIPYLVATAEGDLLELPVQWIIDDFPHFSMNHGGISSPQKVFEVWSTEFAGYHRFNGCFVLTMHPFVSGRPSRIALLEQMITYINQFEGVWWATMEEIADYCLAAGNCDVWTPPILRP